MGTRSITKVYNDEGKPICTIYRHMDGYPSGHGQVLADWLSQKTIVNGIGSAWPGKDEGKQQANGMGDLAAQLVCYLKSGSDVGGIYLHPPNTKDLGQDYSYHILLHNGELMLKVNSGRKNLFYAFPKNFNGLAIEAKENSKHE